MPLDPDLLRTLSAHAVPTLFVLGAVVAGRDGVPAAAAWRWTRRCAALAALTAVATFGVALGGETPWAAARALVLVLIGGLGVVLAGFTATYLAGEPGQPRFVRWFLATLAGSSLVVASAHLGVLAAAWFATSLSLQNLLLFYGDRPAAQMAAHKKFLVSRTADLCLAAAAIVLGLEFGTLDIDALCAAAAAAPAADGSLQAAAILIAAAALLKTAQLPFHGWLMQVMEAPTPVSALLHAGVVNLGGFVLIRLYPLIAQVTAAQVALVVLGSLTAALAGLVATTRVSVKVALAWSTCAQMGFMVLQCGLGLPEMALLHLLAHSLYKANAFLGAGSTVHHAMVKAMTPAAPVPTVTARLGAAVVAAALVAGAAWLWSAPTDVPGLAAMAFVVTLALVPLLAGGERPRTFAGWGVRLVPPLAVALVYFGLHRGLHAWLGDTAAPSSMAVPLATAAAVCFALLFAAQTLIAVRPGHALSRRLHPWCFGGFYLDEWFTRLTLRVWPIRRPDPRSTAVPDRLPEIQ